MIPVVLLAPLLFTHLGERSSAAPDVLPSILYEIDLSDHSDDLFHVTVTPPPLGPEDKFFDFVATAPGTYSVLDFGRFVQSLEALDAQGAQVPVEQQGTNRWKLSDPERVASIVYAIEDTLGSDLAGPGMMSAGGTGIEGTYIILNTFATLGYFEHHLNVPVRLRLQHNPEWLVGTALRKTSSGEYQASSYRTLADSPILMGELSSTGIFVGDIEVEIFVHSEDARLSADEVLFAAGDVLVAAEKFIGFAPVDRYVFLMDFMSMESMQRNGVRAMGALEHSYSSLYTLPASGSSLERLAEVIAHEFMHILTPLHLKSEAIANFDYSSPRLDQHLWLYEGVTEWSAHMLRLRAGLTNLESHLQTLSRKIQTSRFFDQDYSLAQISTEWATDAGARQYPNVYQLGAVTASILDLRLLELSKGERGLRDVFLDFVKQHGPKAPFDSERFFEKFVAATYPELGSFFEDHVQGSLPLPYAQAFALV
ncbi:MAG: putative metalloprotease with PDZ domain, partial [Planctomycetota bacterium]